MKKRIKSGFSLIEISVVLFIITILIIVIGKGSSMAISKAKLKSAQALTKSAPVNSIAGVVLWLEPTLDKAFKNSGNSFLVKEGDAVKNWYDINPSGVNFVATESTNMPFYETNGINNLPTLFFDAAANGATGDVLTIPFNHNLNSETFTTFVVTQALQATSSWGTVIMNRNWSATPSVTGYNLYKNNNNSNWEVWHSGSSAISATLTFNRPFIFSIYHNSTTTRFYQNGNLASSSSNSSFVKNYDNAFTIGATNTGTTFYYDGYISEIIVFNRALRDEERIAVEKYLSKKYAVTTS